MKRLLIFLLILCSLAAGAQALPGYFTPVATPYEWTNYVRFARGLRLPQDTLPGAEVGSLTAKDGAPYFKGPSGWIELGAGGSISAPDKQLIIGTGSGTTSSSLLTYYEGALAVGAGLTPGAGRVDLGSVLFKEWGSISAPTTGHGMLWAKMDGHLWYTNAAGNEFDLTGGGSASRFGAEDDTAAENRSFNIGANNFSLTGDDAGVFIYNGVSKYVELWGWDETAGSSYIDVGGGAVSIWADADLNLELVDLPELTTSYVLYYDPTTGQVTHGAAGEGGGGGSTLNDVLTAGNSSSLEMWLGVGFDFGDYRLQVQGDIWVAGQIHGLTGIMLNPQSGTSFDPVGWPGLMYYDGSVAPHELRAAIFGSWKTILAAHEALSTTTNTVTTKIPISVNGTIYYLLASTSND